MTSRMWQEIQDQYDVAVRLTGDGRPDNLDALQAAVRQTRRLILSGTGASLAACRVGAYAFMKYAGILPHVLPAAELAYVTAGPDTLVMLVSQSGESLETKTAIQTLRDRGIPFWGVTNNRESALARGADEVLWMNAGEEVSSATKTYLATLVLFLQVACAPVENLPAAIRETLAVSGDPVNRWAEELLERDVLYILGAGTLGATADQGALLMKEKTFKHAEGLSLSEFRHGNIEVMRPGLPILVLAVTPESTVEAMRHSEYFASLGAEVYLLTDSPTGETRLPEGRVLQVAAAGDEVTGQLPIVIPLQLLAERIAFRKGYDVDGFRFIAKVVDKYKL